MSLIVGPYYRGDPKLLVEQWGPFSAVQSALFHNLEKIGIDPATILRANPMWNPGNQQDYAKNQIGINTNAVFKNNHLDLNLIGATGVPHHITSPNFLLDSDFTVISDFSIEARIAYAGVIMYGTGAVADGFYLRETNTNNQLQFRVWSSNVAYDATASSALEYGKVGHFDATYNGQSKLRADGVLLASSSAGGGTIDSVSNGLLDIGYDSSEGALRRSRLSIYQLLIFNTVLDDAILDRFYDNRYQLWQPDPQKTIFSPLGGDTNLPINLTGSAISGGVIESEIVSGGETIILTITGDTWVVTVGDDNAITDALISGISSAQSEATGWNVEVRDNMVFGDVIRTSDTVITITLAEEASYAITANETITITIPASALTTTDVETEATPTFDITNESAFNPAWALCCNNLLSGGTINV